MPLFMTVISEGMASKPSAMVARTAIVEGMASKIEIAGIWCTDGNLWNLQTEIKCGKKLLCLHSSWSIRSCSEKIFCLIDVLKYFEACFVFYQVKRWRFWRFEAVRAMCVGEIFNIESCKPCGVWFLCFWEVLCVVFGNLVCAILFPHDSLELKEM